MESDKSPWQACWLASINTAVPFLDFSCVMPPACMCLHWSPRTAGSGSALSESSPVAVAQDQQAGHFLMLIHLLEKGTRSLTKIQTEMLWTWKCQKVWNSNVWYQDEGCAGYSREGAGVWQGYTLALSCVTARSHILLSMPTLSICWFMKRVVCPRYLGVNSLTLIRLLKTYLCIKIGEVISSFPSDVEDQKNEKSDKCNACVVGVCMQMLLGVVSRGLSKFAHLW